MRDTRPPPPPPRTAGLEAAAVAAAAEALRGTVAVARALVESGRRVELAGLEEEASRLCAAAACLPRAAAAAASILPAIEGAVREVDALRAALSDGEGASRRGTPP